MRRVAAAALALVVAPLVACSDDGPGPGEARLEVDGRAIVERADGDRDVVEDSTDVHRGDRVALDEGAALMRLAGGTVFELREGLRNPEDPEEEAAGTAVVMGDRPVLEAGDLLVTTPGSIGLEADGTDVEVTGGAARLTRAFGMSVAAYDADVSLDSAGVPADVPALRQMVVPDLGRPPQRPRPITYREHDTWDRRFLGATMALDQRLVAMGDGLTQTLAPGEGRTVGFYKLVLPGLDDEPEFADDLLAPVRDGRPGDTLIGAAIADLGEDGGFRERWREVFEFHDQGAAWGIVALDQQVRSAPLVGSVEEALNSFDDAADFVLPPEADPSSPTTTPSGPGAGGGGSGPGGGGGGGGGGGTPTTAPSGSLPPPITLPPPTTTVPPATEPVVDPIEDLLDDLVGGLIGGLLGGG